MKKQMRFVVRAVVAFLLCLAPGILHAQAPPSEPPTNFLDSWNFIDTNAWTSDLGYTPAGHLASEAGLWASDSVSYTYSQQLRTALTLTQPGGSWSQSYGYDSMWRMTSLVSPAGTFAYRYNFQPASALVSQIALPNDANITNSYDALARLTGTALNNYWGHTLDGATYQDDPLGLRTNIVRSLGLSSSSVSIGYDLINQLTSWSAKESSGAARLNEQLTFGYDAAHNLHSRSNGILRKRSIRTPPTSLRT